MWLAFMHAKLKFANFILILSFLPFYSCGDFKNDFSNHIYECGNSNVDYESYFSIKAFIDQEAITDLTKDEVTVLNHNDGSLIENFTVSTKSCIMIAKEESSDSLVIALSNRWAYALIPALSENINKVQFVQDRISPEVYVDMDHRSVKPGVIVPIHVSKPAMIRYCFQAADTKRNRSSTCQQTMHINLLTSIRESNHGLMQVPKENGRYTLVIEAIDLARNKVERQFEITVDGTLPAVIPDYYSNRPQYPYFGEQRFYVDTGYRLGFDSTTDPLNSLRIEYCINRVDKDNSTGPTNSEGCTDGDWKVFGESLEIERFYEGIWEIYYRAIDQAGNQSVESWERSTFFVSKECSLDLNQDLATFLDRSFTNCTKVLGNISLGQINLDQLEMFSSILEVEGSLDISGQKSLINLVGFENLHQIGNLNVDSNSSLVSLQGLDNLRHIRQDIKIIKNPKLADISALKNIKFLSGQIEIVDNMSLKSLEGLSPISVGVDIFIQDLLDLENLDNFKELKSVPVIDFYGLDSLTSIEGLKNLSNVNSILFRQLPSLRSLSGLSGVKELKILLLEQLSALEELDGLDNLTSIYGSLFLFSNQRMTQMPGLKNIHSFEGEAIKIRNNTSLKSLDGLAELEVIQGDFEISNNFALKNLRGLEKLRRVYGNFNIETHANLENFAGLEQLREIDGNLYIRSNQLLKNFEGLSSLTRVKKHIHVTGNAQLENFQGLSSLHTIGGDLKIQGNDSLKNLSGLEELRSIGNELSLINNKSLVSVSELRNDLTLKKFHVKGNLIQCDEQFQCDLKEEE